jgi:hypothetical protein
MPEINARLWIEFYSRECVGWVNLSFETDAEPRLEKAPRRRTIGGAAIGQL